MILAPMQGLTEVLFRRVYEECFPGAIALAVSPFIALTKNLRFSTDNAQIADAERQLADGERQLEQELENGKWMIFDGFLEIDKNEKLLNTLNALKDLSENPVTIKIEDINNTPGDSSK